MDSTLQTGKMVQCVVVTPERAVLDETVEFVALTMLDGELGVLPGRAPLIGRLGFGELRTVVGQTTHRYFIDGGFTQIRDNVVTVLTPKAVPAGDIKLDRAEEDLKSALGVALTPEAQEAQLKAQERARAQIRVAHKLSGADGH